MAKKAVVLLSGGLDSTTTLAVAIRDGFTPYAITFRYGQRHGVEIEAAAAVAKHFAVAEHLVIDANLRVFGHSSLTDDIPIPKGRDPGEIGDGIPVTYVPARNTIFLSFALAWAEVLECWDIFVGVNAIDYSGYPDCRPEYLQAYERMANLATKAAVERDKRLTIHAPLINLRKSEIIALGVSLGVDYGVTRTCYDPSPNGEACRACDACILRLAGFAANGMRDPAPYRAVAKKAQ